MTILYAHIMLKVYSFGMEICPFEVNDLPFRNGVTSVTFSMPVSLTAIFTGTEQ